MTEKNKNKLLATLMEVVDGDPETEMNRLGISVDDASEASGAVLQVVISEAEDIMGGAGKALDQEDLMFIFILGVFVGSRYEA